MMHRMRVSSSRSASGLLRRISLRNSDVGLVVSKASNTMPFIGLAVGASLFYLLEEMKSANIHLDSSKLFSVVDQLLPFSISRFGQLQQQVTLMPLQQQKVQFPSLNAQLVQSSGSDQQIRHNDNNSIIFPINSDEPIPIDNHLFKGTATLVLRPLQSEHDPKFQQRLPLCLEQSRDDTPSFYFLLQGKFKRPIPKDALLVGGELLDPYVMDHTLSSFTRRWADLLLRLLSRNIGGSMSYSFGGKRGRNKSTDAGVECPHIAFPVTSAMMINQDSEGSCGTIDVWDTETVYSFMYCASSIDLASWKVIYPFEMDIRRFWGDSPLRLVIYEKSKDGQNRNNYVFELQLDNIKQF
jgi:hypothetical protein